MSLNDLAGQLSDDQGAREPTQNDYLARWKTIAEKGTIERPPLIDLIRAGHAPKMLGTAAPPVEYLWEGIIPLHTANISSGNAKIGKTWRALQFAIHAAIGRPFLGRRVRRSRVLVCEEEGTIESTSNRLELVADWMGVTKEDLDFLYVVPRPRLRLYELENVAEFAATLDELSRDGMHFDLILLGPLTRIAHFEDENKAGEVSKFWERLQNLAPELRTTFDISHHNKKAGGALSRNVEEAIDNIRGSVANQQEPDTMTGIVRDPARQQGHLFARGRDVRRDDGGGGDLWIPYELKEGTMLMVPSDHKVVERPEAQSQILAWLADNYGTGPHTTRDILAGLRTQPKRSLWIGNDQSKKKMVERNLVPLLTEQTPEGDKIVEPGEKAGSANTYGLTDAYYELVCQEAGVEPDLPEAIIALHQRSLDIGESA